MPRPLTVLLLLLFVGIATPAQAQRCGRSDTLAIANGGTTTVEIDIDGYLNNDLSAVTQGLANIRLYFSQSFIYDVRITLTSPAGQSVTLVGPILGQSRSSTVGKRWFVDFVPCDSVAVPGDGARERWDNTSDYEWGAFGINVGSYYPNDGCLEDFDLGPVNGTWTITVENALNNQSGQFTYLLLDFVNPLNINGPCCLADAGLLLVDDPPYVGCVTDPNLDFDLDDNVRYGQPRPDSSAYAYGYLIARNDTLVALRDRADLAGLPGGGYQICGLSYRRGERAQFPDDGSFTLDVFRDELVNSPTPPLCADLTQNCYTVTLFDVPEATDLVETICSGDSYTVGTSTYDITGIYRDVLTSRGGCDSVVNLNLTVVDQLRATTPVTICAEGSYPQGGNLYDAPGTYVDTLVSTFGCDSVSTIVLSVDPPIVTSIDTAICAGTTFFLGAEAFTATTTVARVLTAANGCDSTVNLDLLVLEPTIVFEPFSSVLDCRTPRQTLSAVNSTFVQPEIRWLDGAGNELGRDFTLEVDTAGTYVFELSDRARAARCTVRDSIVLTDERFVITLGDLSDRYVLNCENASIRLEPQLTPALSTYQFDWTTIAGPDLVTGSGFATAEAPGNYHLGITDTETGCALDTTFAITQDTTAPDATITGPTTLNCELTELRLAVDSTQIRASELDYEWILPDGRTTADPQIVVGQHGTIGLTVRNRVNGCRDTNTIDVARDTVRPVLTLAPATAPLSCYEPERTLAPAFPGGTANLTFAWTDAALDTASTQPVFTTAVAGNFTLTALDTTNRCSATATTVIPADTTAPTALVAPAQTAINCYDPAPELTTTGSSTGPNFQYTWTRPAFPSDTLGTGPSLTASAPGGIYQLRIFNRDNGCVTTAESRVFVSLDTPEIRLTPVTEFDCFDEFVELDASNTGLGFPAEIAWTGPCFDGRSDTTTVRATCPGDYTFSILNTENGCAADTTVAVRLATGTVIAVLPDTVLLDCDTGSARIDRSAGTDAPVVRWLYEGEPIGLAGQRPRVTTPGTYALVLGNFNEACLDTAYTEVVADCPALAVIVPPDSLTCRNNNAVTLNAGPSFPARGPGVTEGWIVPPGLTTVPIVGEPRRLLIISPGTYGYFVRNELSGATDTTFVTVLERNQDPNIVAGGGGTITCLDTSILLDGSGTDAGPGFAYAWINTFGDTLATELLTEVSERGTYRLFVENTGTGCDSESDPVVVSRNIDDPSVSVSGLTIPCDTSSFDVTAQVDGETNAFFYRWTGPEVLGGADSVTVTVGEAGSLALTVTDTLNGCVSELTAEVNRAPCPPFPALIDTVLSCVDTPLVLRPTFRDPCVGCTYRWRLNGDVVVGASGAELVAREVGFYEIQVTNGLGLIGSARSFVGDARFVPDDQAGPDRTLTCARTAVALGTDRPDTTYRYAYRWLDGTGGAVAGAEELFYRTERDGIFQLETTNLSSGCVGLDTVVVTYDTVAPLVEAGPDRTLTCDAPRQVLDGNDSERASSLVYEWRGGPSVACLTGTGTPNPLVKCAGSYTLRVSDTLTGCFAEDAVAVVGDDELPLIVPPPDQMLDCNRPEVRLPGSLSDSLNQHFRWDRIDNGTATEVTDSALAPDLTVSGTGTFRYTVTNRTTGCRNEFDVSVREDFRQPTAEAGPRDTFYCELNELRLGGVGSISNGGLPSVRWRSATGFQINEATTLTPTIFERDRYYLDVTDPVNGCTATDSVEIVQDIEAPNVEAGVDTTLNCVRRQVMLQAMATTVSGGATYAWSSVAIGNIRTAPDGATFPASAAGKYLVRVTDPGNGCTSSDIVTVSEDTIAPTIVFARRRGLSIDCRRPSVVLDASGSQPAGDVNFRWRGIGARPIRGNDVDPQTTAFAAGIYRLTLTDRRNGCTAVDSLLVSEDFTPPPGRPEVAGTFTCRRDSVDLLVRPGNQRPGLLYRWLDAGGTTLADTAVTAVGDSGTYRLVTLSTFNGCADTTAVTTPVNRTPPQIVLRQPDVLNCGRAVSTIDAGGTERDPNFLARWSGPGGAVAGTDDPYRVIGRRPGIYRLRIEDRATGCVASDSVELVLVAATLDGLALEVEQPPCPIRAKGSVAVVGIEGGTPPFTFRLNGGVPTQRMLFDGLRPGDYELAVSDTNGCRMAERFAIVPGPEVALNLRSDTTIFLGDSLSLDFVTTLPDWDTLIWESAGALPAGASVAGGPITVTPTESQAYSLTIRSGAGCVATDDVFIRVDQRTVAFVPNGFSPNGDNNNERFRPFPGPQVDRILAFRVFDRWGELVYDLANDNLAASDDFGWDGTLSGRPLNPAVFVWQLELLLLDGTTEWRTGEVVLVR